MTRDCFSGPFSAGEPSNEPRTAMDDVDVLLVEDDEGDVAQFERAFEDLGLSGTLHSVQTGPAALDWLSRRGEFGGVPRADVVLLDLDLPGSAGLDALDAIKTDPDLTGTPVVVLAGSASDSDLLDAYDRFANACVTKPVDPDEYADFVRTLTDFWVDTATLPPNRD